MLECFIEAINDGLSIHLTEDDKEVLRFAMADYALAVRYDLGAIIEAYTVVDAAFLDQEEEDAG